MALFNKDIKKFVRGRKGIFEKLQNEIKPSDRILWFHAASLGEYEQGLPVIEKAKERFENHRILVTFFSPSGHEVKKNDPKVDMVTYLPLDTKANAQHFLDIVKPEMAIFIKYEFWPNLLIELKARKIHTLLISAVFRKDQIFFKSYGSLMRKRLHAFTHFFVQDENSAALLRGIHFENVSISGDTRYDRVSEILRQDQELDFAARFKTGKLCIVAGSTWPEDEALFIDYINQTAQEVKFIIAPHKIANERIEVLVSKLQKKVARYSEMERDDLAASDVLVIDTIGLLSKLYKYADIAYVGGAMGNTGLHNTLEAAVHGIPVIIGQHYRGFPEAETLIEKGGYVSVNGQQSFYQHLGSLIENPTLRASKGNINKEFTQKNRGASVQIVDFLRKSIEK